MPNDESRKRGEALMRVYFGEVSPFPDVRDDFADFTVANLFGDVWSRSGISLEQRSRLTLMVLAALARWPEFRIHLRGAHHIGVSLGEIEEMMIHLAHYAGWPCGLTGRNHAREVYAELEAEKKG